MKTIQIDVLVIGGGATGTGIVRDLAMRGFKTALVERRDLAHGTTGRYHGLLHSGGRYVLKDPQAARECIEENRTLRKIIPHCIEDTGGYFVVTPWDDPAYGDKFVQGCHQAGIPVDEIPTSQLLREEPLINPQIRRCFRVPDASADSFLAADANAESARQYGAQIFTYHEVRRLVNGQGRVKGAICYSLVDNEEVQFDADLVVNASGAWAGKIAATIGLVVQIKPGKGTMVAINHRVVNTVINRCKMPADGDIIVPAHTVAVIGTTDEQVADPDHFAIEPWEIELMLQEGEKLIPGLKSMRMLRAWAGVRPLYQETSANSSRDITRAFVLLDHEKRDGISGLLTITSGKWTTYRKMAEATVDLVCEKLDIHRACQTHLEVIPAQDIHHPRHHYLGSRLANIEKNKAFGSLICECELATKDEIVRSIIVGEAKTLDDVRRDTRMGMGPCQGGFCTLRAAGILFQLHEQPVEQTNVALRDFLQERWKGLLTVLWGQQLRQERLDELIYLNVLNVDHLPGAKASLLGPEHYDPAVYQSQQTNQNQLQNITTAATSPIGHPIVDVMVIGAGLAGLSSAWFTASQGRKVHVISKGWGSIYWSSGCVDVLGYTEQNPGQLIVDLLPALESMIKRQPAHPYALAGLDNLERALNAFKDLCTQGNYPMIALESDAVLAKNWLLPTAIGSLRPTTLAPITMVAGNCREPTQQLSMVLVGFHNFHDFYPHLAAANLTAQGIPAQAVILDLPILRQRNFVNSLVLARLFEDPAFRADVVQALRVPLGKICDQLSGLRVGFPAVLGINQAFSVWEDLQYQLGCPVFELPGLPPSVPGMRLQGILTREIEKFGGRIFEGMQVIQAKVNNGVVEAIVSEAAARPKIHRANRFILATGGILGGGFIADPSGSIHEIVFNLPLNLSEKRDLWFQREFLAEGGHPIYHAGIQVDSNFQPLDFNNKPIYRNLFTAGSTTAGFDGLRERSIEGIALATSFAIIHNSGTDK